MIIVDAGKNMSPGSVMCEAGSDQGMYSPYMLPSFHCVGHMPPIAVSKRLQHNH